MTLAHKGWSAAIFRAKFEHWVPFSFRHDAAQHAQGQQERPVMSQEEAERRHVLAVVSGGIGMQTTSREQDHRMAKCFFCAPQNALDVVVGTLFIFQTSSALLITLGHMVFIFGLHRARI